MTEITKTLREIAITLEGDKAVDHIVNAAASAVNAASKERESRFFRNIGLALTILGFIGIGAVYKTLESTITKQVNERISKQEITFNEVLLKGKEDLRYIALLQELALQATSFQVRKEIPKNELIEFSRKVLSSIEKNPKLKEAPLFFVIINSLVSKAIDNDEYTLLAELDSKIQRRILESKDLLNLLGDYFVFRLVTEQLTPSELKKDNERAEKYMIAQSQKGFPESYYFNKYLILYRNGDYQELKEKITRLSQLGDIDREWFFKRMDQMLNEKQAEKRYLKYVKLLKEIYAAHGKELEKYRVNTTDV